MKDLKNKLKKLKITGLFARAKGCTKVEIDNLEFKLNKNLPNRYKDFLTFFGHGAGNLFKGSDFEYQYLVENQEFIEDLSKLHNVDADRVSDIFVFMVHQGYITFYFYCNENDDPKVFRHYEGDTKANEIAASLTDFLNNAVEAVVAEKRRSKIGSR